MNLEHEFTQYLTMIGLNRHTMNPIQLKETRKAFYAGIGFLYTQFIYWSSQDEDSDDKNAAEALDIGRQLNEFIESQKPTTKI